MKADKVVQLPKIPSVYDLFRVKSPGADLSKIPITDICTIGNFRHSKTRYNAQFFFDYMTLRRILTNINELTPLWIWGPSGCGKTETIQQIAIRLTRPLFIISFSEDTRIKDLLGMTGLVETQYEHPAETEKSVFQPRNTVTKFQPGILYKAIRTPFAVVVFDEINMALPGVVSELNALLESRTIMVAETGERLTCADHVAMIATANTCGGFDETGIYQGSQAQNGATMNRFSGLRMNYLPKEKEIIMLRMMFPEIDKTLVPVDGGKTFTELAVDLAHLIRNLVKDGGVRLPFTVRDLKLFISRTLLYSNDVREGFYDAYYDLLNESERVKVAESFKAVFAIDLE